MSTVGNTRIIEHAGISAGLSASPDAVSLPLGPACDTRSGLISFLQRLCSFPAMLASLLVGIVFAATRVFTLDPDVWWHLKVGQFILSSHRWPTTDVYSFTAHGQPWLAYEWLGEVFLTFAYRIGGLSGLALLSLLLGSGVVLALYILASIRSENSKAGFVATAVLSVFAVISFSLRPQMIGYLFIVLTLIALERFRQGKYRMLWCFPVLMLFWVNTHGSWIIGMATVVVYWISGLFEFQMASLEAVPWTASERRQISSIFLLSLLTLPLTPYGTRIAASPFEYAFSLPLNIAYIVEWQPMPFQDLVGKAFLALFLFIVIGFVILNLRWRVEEFFLFLLGSAMACLHTRFVLVFVPFTALILGRIVSRWIRPYDAAKDKPLLNAAFMFFVVAIVIHFFPASRNLADRVSKAFPVGAVNYMVQNNVPEPMYNNYDFGGYLVWARGPRHKVYIDGRADLYERGGVFADYMHISRVKPAALEVLREYNVQSCLTQPDEPLSTLLSASSDWARVYADNVSDIFVRKRPWKQSR